jgi:hypothetical protein
VWLAIRPLNVVPSFYNALLLMAAEPPSNIRSVDDTAKVVAMNA